jgi:hypothetical protein
MKLTRRAKVVAATLAVTVGGVVAAVVPGSPAVAFQSGPLFLDAQVESGTLVARGAAVDVVVDVACTSPTAFVDVSLTQRVGSEIASGFGFAEVGCTGGSQRVVVTVTASGGKAFRKQAAVATATVSGCAGNVCGSENDTETIDLQR